MLESTTNTIFRTWGEKKMSAIPNCWEFMKCGREKTGECAAVEKKAGDVCWIIAGTMCGGKPQGSFAQKVGSCKKCDYYQYMQGITSGVAAVSS